MQGALDRKVRKAEVYQCVSCILSLTPPFLQRLIDSRLADKERSSEEDGFEEPRRPNRRRHSLLMETNPLPPRSTLVFSHSPLARPAAPPLLNSSNLPFPRFLSSIHPHTLD
jgi:hypothetical protein